MSEHLKGKNAVVTGAAGGLGKAICLALAREGANVVCNDIGADRTGAGAEKSAVDKVVDEVKATGVKAIANYDSVVDFNAAEKLIQTCVDEFGSIDILINTHGNLRDRMIWNMSEEEWDNVVAVHLKGTFNTCRHACVRMREQKSGRIINVASDAWRGTMGHVNYGAVKGGIVSLTRSIARELGRYRVTCNAFAPIAATRMTLSDEVVKGTWKRVEAGVMSKEEAEKMMAMPGPEHIPPLLVYLATDFAGDINGQVFHTSGGRVGIYSEPIEVRSAYKDINLGPFTIDEMITIVPQTLLQGYINPAPPQPERDK
ncbi:MAG: SDR family NAD(P)-dependent oxidoreductase [Chloroflexota bacterium]|nr:SDR family NAD(P)-dependent oxidoreductase [Chloroflexota bacterium]